MSEHRVTSYLGLGSNLGDREQYLRRAISHLAKDSSTAVDAVSSVYESPAKTRRSGDVQPDYLNAAARITTVLAPQELLAVCVEVEHRCGRVPGGEWDSRTLDIDILLYGDLRLQSGTLTIPHPGMMRRKFVLLPLADIVEENTIIPSLGQTVEELLAACDDEDQPIRTLVDLSLP